MPMRVIIRFSLNGDHGSDIRKNLNDILENAGIKKSKSTGTYEGDVRRKAILEALKNFWKAVGRNRTRNYMDHFWMYVDNNPEEEARPTTKRRIAKRQVKKKRSIKKRAVK